MHTCKVTTIHSKVYKPKNFDNEFPESANHHLHVANKLPQVSVHLLNAMVL